MTRRSKAVADSELNVYGSVLGPIVRLAKHRSSPALILKERLSDADITCILDAELAEKIGPEHRWPEGWEEKLFNVAGRLIYGSDGKIRKVEACSIEEFKWPEAVCLEEVRKIDILQGRTIREHLDLLWRDPLD